MASDRGMVSFGDVVVAAAAVAAAPQLSPIVAVPAVPAIDIVVFSWL